MGRPERLFDWFKCLPAHKRIDYMCGLLRLCLPLELRFLGSVLENLARKDFHMLRDQENKANHRADLSANTSFSLSDQKLRAKIITALALMNSSNSPCAQVIFDIIQQQEVDGLLKQSHSSSFMAADLMIMLTMAVNHPAFSFHQRSQLGRVLKRVQRYMGEPSGDDSSDAEERNVHVYTSTVPHGFCQPGCIEHTVSEGDIPYCSCEPPQTSGRNSPVNSRTCSPSSVSSHTDTSCRFAGANTAAPPSACPADCTFQLLHLLSLDDYCSNLRADPVQQVIHTNKEECAKAGLPPELEVQSRSKLGQGRSPYMNGVVDAARLSWTTAPAVLYQPLYQQPLAHYIPHLAHMPGYVAPSRHTSVPPGHPRPGQGSAGSSQTPSPPSSPQLQQAGAGQPTDPASHSTPTLGLHLMFPAGTVAMDTQTISDVNMECAESCSSEDEKPPGYDQAGKYRRPSTAQQSQSLPVINQDTVVLSSREAAKPTSMLPAPITHPHLLAAAESGTRTPPPQTAVGVASACPHISTSHVGLVNGYLSQPAPAPVQGAVAVGGPRGILHSRTLAAVQQQPGHSGLHRPPPVSDAQQWYAHLAKNGANYNSLSEHPAGLPLPSYIPLASSTPMMMLSPANFQLSNTGHLPAQSSSAAPVIPDGSSSYSRGVIAQPPGMHTSIANSSLVGTTPSHSSPTPSPAVYVDQLQPSSYVIETTDPSRAEESCVSPPAQTPSIVAAIKSHSNASSTSSGTPSPPLVPTSHKQAGPSDAQSNWRAPYMLGYINSYVPVFYPTVRHQQQQTFPPNGLVPEFGTFVRLPPHTPASHLPVLYPPQSSAHTTVSPSTTSQSSTATHIACYNCGYTGHQVCDCQESRMETVSNTFHLKYNPRGPPT